MPRCRRCGRRKNPKTDFRENEICLSRRPSTKKFRGGIVEGLTERLRRRTAKENARKRHGKEREKMCQKNVMESDKEEEVHRISVGPELDTRDPNPMNLNGFL